MVQELALNVYHRGKEYKRFNITDTNPKEETIYVQLKYNLRQTSVLERVFLSFFYSQGKVNPLQFSVGPCPLFASTVLFSSVNCIFTANPPPLERRYINISTSLQGSSSLFNWRRKRKKLISEIHSVIKQGLLIFNFFLLQAQLFLLEWMCRLKIWTVFQKSIWYATVA